MANDHARGVLHALSWSTVSTVGNQFISFIIFAMLARLLGIHDFGVVMLAAICIDLMQVAAACGMTEAIIQRQSSGDEEASTAFWIGLSSGLLFFLIANMLAGTAADLMAQSELAPVIRGLSVIFLITPLGSIHNAMLARDLEFKSLAYRGLIANFVSGIIGIGLAATGQGVWALVAQRITFAFIMAMLVWVLCRWRPRLEFRPQAMKTLLSFGLKIMGSQLLVQLSTRLTDLISGFLIGPSAVAFIRVGSRCVDILNQITFTPFNQVALPILSRSNGNPQAIRSTFVTFSRISSAAMFPAFLGLAAIADPLVMIVFGPEWMPAAIAVKIICFTVFPLQFNVLLISTLTATGHARAVLFWSMAQIALGLVVIAYAAQFGWVAMLGASVARAYILLPVGIYLLHRTTALSVWTVARSIRPAAISAIAMAICVGLLDHAAASTLSAPVRMAVGPMAGIVLYLAILVLVERSLIKEVMSFFRRSERGRAIGDASV